MKPGATVRLAGKFDLASLDSMARKALADGINRDLFAIHEQAVDGVNEESFGEFQRRYNPPRDVVSSKPGDPPNTDRGTFVKSIQVDPATPDSLSGRVGTNDPRGPWFEIGTIRMDARPWLGPAVRKLKRHLGKYDVEFE